jgi:hypothetical protein
MLAGLFFHIMAPHQLVGLYHAPSRTETERADLGPSGRYPARSFAPSAWWPEVLAGVWLTSQPAPRMRVDLS